MNPPSLKPTELFLDSFANLFYLLNLKNLLEKVDLGLGAPASAAEPEG